MSLRSLDLSRNSIGQIGKMAFGSSEGFGQNGGVNSLQRLGMAGNRIRELVSFCIL
jgi:Leucine-rich repeat (LRR) protein